MIKKLLLLSCWLCLLATIAPGQDLKFNTQDFRPFNYEENGRVSGPAADIIRAVCQKIDTSCSFKLMVWKDAQQEVRDGKANGMFVIGWNKSRSDWLYFSPQIMQTEYGFFVANDNSLNYREVRDLSGYTIGVYGPSNTSKSLEQIQAKMEIDKTMTPIHIDLHPDDIELFKNLNSPQRTLTAVFSNRDVGNDIIRNGNLQNIRYAGGYRQLDYFIGFSKENTDKNLVQRFNIAYIELYLSGEIARILSRYGMEPATIEPYIITYYTKSFK